VPPGQPPGTLPPPWPNSIWPPPTPGGPGGPTIYCFAAGTKILLPDGGAKSIESLKKGDLVASFNGLEKKLESDRVLSVSVRKNVRTLNIDGIVVTSEHPFLTPTGDWRRAGALHAGDKLVRADGSTLAIKSIKDGPTTAVYNMEVDRNHTFVANGVRVHNKPNPNPYYWWWWWWWYYYGWYWFEYGLFPMDVVNGVGP
jgi:hypothetical protein